MIGKAGSHWKGVREIQAPQLHLTPFTGMASIWHSRLSKVEGLLEALPCSANKDHVPTLGMRASQRTITHACCR